MRRWIAGVRARPRIAALVGFLVGLLLAAFIGIFVVAPLALTHRTTWPLETGFGHFAVNLAVGARAGSAHNPRTADQATLEQGRNAYLGSCAYCHGPTGNGKGGSLSASLFPPATDLTAGDAKEKSDAELFWVIKNGLSFTAMPGYRDKYNDDAIWAIVAYLRALQGKTSAAAPTPPAVPTPSAEQLSAANLQGDAAARGAALYFAENCFQCHGGAGNAAGPLGFRMLGPDAEVACQIRYGPNGMPVFDSAKLSDAQVADLIAFLRTLVANRATPGAAGPPGGPRGTPPAGGPPGGFPGGGTPPPDRYSGTAYGEAPACIPERGGRPSGTPGAAGTPRPGGAAASPTPAR
ncbi:MAG TPA: c-type cytochrome [Dehalococcoidia bacterium]